MNKAIELQQQGLSSALVASKLSEIFGKEISQVSVQHKLQREGHAFSKVGHREWNDDGVQTSTTILEVINGQKLTPEDVIKAHGYDPKQWEITKNISNFWKQKEDVTSYQSKISIKPRSHIPVEELSKILNERVKPITIRAENDGKHNLVIPLYDMHFGIMTFDLLKNQLAEIKAIIERGYKRIVIEQGGDLLHSDKMTKAETVKGTQLDPVDMVQAVKDAKRFYDEVIQCALKNSKKVDIYGVGGNHDYDLAYLFTDGLSDRYPQVDTHNTLDVRQTYQLDKVGIMLAHGDKAQKKLPMLFATESPYIWSSSNYREIHFGHFHKEVTHDDYGVVTRQIGTPKLNDPYEVSNGYTMATHKLQLFEYGVDRLKATYEI
ncbi:helix-turn-helix domain-containing protein [Paucilactobacillus sp. N302-9]